MMNWDILITDFSGVYKDGGLPGALNALGVGYNYIQMGDIEGTSCYCDDAAAAEIRRRIRPFLGKPGIRWIDSGDYHYMTLFTTETIAEPFSLVLFDNHPDDIEAEFGGVLSCGGWVGNMRKERTMMKEVVAVGPGGHVPFVPRRYGSVYISIDKDILSPEWARTDWSQGEYTLQELLDAVGSVIECSDRVLGIDICGALSSAHGATEKDFAINLSTDMALYEYIANKIR